MNDIRKLVASLASLPKEQVEKIVRAADASRNVEQLMSGLAPAPVARKKRGPNKPKVTATPVVAEAPKPTRGRPRKDEKPLSSAIERLKAVKAGGVKARRVVEPDDED